MQLSFLSVWKPPLRVSHWEGNPSVGAVGSQGCACQRAGLGHSVLCHLSTGFTQMTKSNDKSKMGLKYLDFFFVPLNPECNPRPMMSICVLAFHYSLEHLAKQDPYG